jgi:hypothetical protein
VRVRTLHVNYTFIFRSLKLGKIRMDKRRLTGIDMDMEQWSVKGRQHQRYDGAGGGHSSHKRILMKY